MITQSMDRLMKSLFWEDENFFVVSTLEVVEFVEHVMTYEVQRTERKEIWAYADLPWHGVLNIVTRASKYYVVEKDFNQC